MKLFRVLLLTSLVTFLSLSFLSSASAIEVTINETNSDGIKGAIDNGNNTINLEEGTYKGDKNTNITISNKNITIQSKNPNKKAIIDGENVNWFINSQGGNLTLVNLIIKNFVKNANFGTLNITSGGAVYNTGKLTIINCTFINNDALYGGAIYNTGNNQTITNSIFANNTAQSGGVIYSTGSSNISNSNFTNNRAINNNGGAIFSGQFTNLNISNSTFINNSANQGGAIYNNNFAKVYIISSTFINNSANQGGAIYNTDGGNLNVSYSRFVDNTDQINYTIYHSGSGSVVSDLNWWGSNLDPNSNIYGVTVNNYFTMLLKTNVSDYNLTVGDNLTYEYLFVLNGTDDNHNASEYFQYFETSIYRNGVLVKVIDARNSTILSTLLISEISNFTAILDNENQSFIYLATPKPQEPEPPTPTPNPVPTPSPELKPESNINQTNKTSNNPVTQATMKETGIPIIAIFLVLLTSLGILTRKK